MNSANPENKSAFVLAASAAFLCICKACSAAGIYVGVVASLSGCGIMALGVRGVSTVLKLFICWVKLVRGSRMSDLCVRLILSSSLGVDVLICSWESGLDRGEPDLDSCACGNIPRIMLVIAAIKSGSLLIAL